MGIIQYYNSPWIGVDDRSGPVIRYDRGLYALGVNCCALSRVIPEKVQTKQEG